MKEFFREIEDIQFTEVDEFYKKKEYIRDRYQELDNNIKQVYKWYFYFQFCLLKNPLKELLWNYVNGENELYFLSELQNEYNSFCNRRKKQKEEESEIDNYY